MKYATEEAFVGANAFGKGAANNAAFLPKWCSSVCPTSATLPA